MSNIKTSNLLAFSECIEKLLSQNFRNIKEILPDKDNIQSINESLPDVEDNIPVIELTIDLIDTEKSSEVTLDKKALTPATSTLIDYADNINDELTKENIFEETDEKLYGDDFKMEKKFDYKELCNKSMDYNWDHSDDDKEMNIYGCKWNDDCKSLWAKKTYNCSDDVFEPICNNAITNVPRMDIITMIAEGQGTINNNDSEPEDPEEPEIGETSSDIAFKFFIGKKYSKYVGNMCLVDYDEKLFLTSEKVECYHSPDHTKFVAVFHFEEGENRSREITVYGTTQICNILPTLFIYSAPHCGEDDEIAIGGSVTTGTITIAKEDAEGGMIH